VHRFATHPLTLGDDAFKTKLAGVLQDKFAVVGVVAIELVAGLVRD
jgi:hypothetical protein